MVGQSDLMLSQLSGSGYASAPQVHCTGCHCIMASTYSWNYFIAVVYNSLYSSVSKETLAFLKQMLGIKVSVELRNGVKQDAMDCS